MPLINQSMSVPYTPQEMYELVNDVERYADFIPWCSRSDVLSRTDDEVKATLAFSAKGFQKSFTTLNRLSPHKMVEIRLIEGPFKQLEGFWRFESVENNASHCHIMLDLEFEFSNKLLAMMFGPVFHQVAVTLVDAFIQRAKDVYGERA